MVIPDYQPSSVHNSDLPNVHFSANATAASFGGQEAENIGQLGQAANKLGNTIANIGLTEQEKVNHDMARGKVNEARLELNQFAQEQYALEGSNAFGASKRIQEQSEKIRQKYSDALQTTASQEIFNNAFSGYAEEHALRAQGFEMHQSKMYRAETLNQENHINAQEIAGFYNDPELVKKRIFEISQNVKAEYSGHGDAAMKAESVVQQTLLNAAAEIAMKDPSQALLFIEQHGDKMGKQAVHLRDVLEKKEFEIRKAEIVLNETSRPGATRESVIESINKTKMPANEKEKTIRDAMTQFNVVDAAKDKDRREANEAAWNTFHSAPDLNTIARLNVDPTTKQKMTDSLEKMLKKKSNDEYAANYGKIQRLSTDEFMKLNLEEVKHDISPYQYDHLKKEQASLRKEGKEKTPGFSKAISDESKEVGQLSAFKIGDKETDVVKAQKQEKLNQYIGEYSERLMQVPDDKRNDPKVRSEIRGQLLKEKIDKGWFWDTHTGNLDYTPGNQPKTRESVLQDKTIPDNKKAAYIIRDDLKSGKISQEQARKRLQEIGY